MNEQTYFFNGKEFFKDNLPIRALLYGEGVFETFRCIDFRLPVYYDRHISRLENGCRYLSVPLHEKEHIRRFISESLIESAIDDAYVKLCILSNGQTYYSALPDSSNVILIIKDYPKIKEKVNLAIAEYRRNSESLIIECKSLNYLENLMLKRKIQNEGYDEAVILNDKDHVSECITHNIFWFSEETMFTPSIDCGILPGVTRWVLINTLNSMGLTVKDGNFTINSLLSSSSVFITNSITGIAEVISISGRNINTNEKLYHDIRQKLLTGLQWI